MNSLKKIEKNRELLHNLMANDSSNSNQIYHQSCILDELILQYMKRQMRFKKSKKNQLV